MGRKSEMATVGTPSRPKEKRNLGRGIRLKGQTKTIICNVYDYFNTLHKKGQSHGPFKRTADATSKQDIFTYVKVEISIYTFS